MNRVNIGKYCSGRGIFLKALRCCLFFFFLSVLGLNMAFASTGESEKTGSREEELFKIIRQLQQTIVQLQKNQAMLQKEIKSLKGEIEIIKSKLAIAGQGQEEVSSTTGEKSGDEYVVELDAVNVRNYGINWFKPFDITMLDKRPRGVRRWPRTRYNRQNYFTMNLGDANENTFNAMIDFREPLGNRFPFTLYYDRDRDLNLAEDFIRDNMNVADINVPYRDGTTEKYSINIYSIYYSKDSRMASLCYQVNTGRWGILETEEGKFSIIIIDGDGNGIFNDIVDSFTIDLNRDAKIESDLKSGERYLLYSPVKISDATYKVKQLDEAGRRLVLQKVQ